MLKAPIPLPIHSVAAGRGVRDSIQEYEDAHAMTLGPGSDEWWATIARETLFWDRPFQTVRSGGFETGDITWFPEGALNASYNCVDRWAYKNPEKIAIIYEANEPGEDKQISYGTLLREVCSIANVLKHLGVRKGDVVSVYLPMTWQFVVAVLACARIGAIHAVVVCGTPSNSLRNRIQDCKPVVVITADEAKRGTKTTCTKSIVDEAIGDNLDVKHVLVLKHTGITVPWTASRDVWWHEETEKVPRYCPPEPMASEDPLFILHTSGTSGYPKGVVHITGGYLLCAALTTKYVFDLHPEDKFGCVADIGWATGHTYVVYGPLCNGITTTVFGSAPLYPSPSRYWQTVEKHKLTHFYTAPTIIGLLRSHGSSYVAPHDLSSLRVIGTIGELLQPDVWSWYNENVGRNKCVVVDTFGQTETGCIVLASFSETIGAKVGSASVPFFGLDMTILDLDTHKELEGSDITGMLAMKTPWPSIARTIYRDHKCYMDSYMKPCPGVFYTGDGAARDTNNSIWIKGRVDDVAVVGAHRIGACEIESVLISHKEVIEAAVIGVGDDLTGQVMQAFLTIQPQFQGNATELTEELKLKVTSSIGALAAPTKLYIVDDLPKTRSGKITRKILGKIIAGESVLNYLNVLDNPGVIGVIKRVITET